MALFFSATSTVTVLPIGLPPARREFLGAGVPVVDTRLLIAAQHTADLFRDLPGTGRLRLVDLNPCDVAADAGVDLIGPAGTAVLFHARAIHNARLKKNSTQRWTLQAYFSNRLDQRTNEWTSIPPRLYQKSDPALPPHFYAKWNVTNIQDGVGRRPADIDPGLPMTEVIKEVQRRGKLKMKG